MHFPRLVKNYLLQMISNECRTGLPKESRREARCRTYSGPRLLPCTFKAASMTRLMNSAWVMPAAAA